MVLICSYFHDLQLCYKRIEKSQIISAPDAVLSCVRIFMHRSVMQKQRENAEIVNTG